MENRGVLDIQGNSRGILKKGVLDIQGNSRGILKNTDIV
jgi:hypothetical protein